MRKTILPALFSAALIVTAPITVGLQVAQAAVASQAVAVNNLNKLLTNTRSMSANFSQSTQGGNAKTNRSFSGTMQVQRPNQFRWQVAGSAAQLIVGNGNTLWVYDKDLNQVTRQKVSNQVGDTPALLLSGNPSTIASSFNVTQPDATRNYYVLYPKTKSANFKSLSIAFNGGNPVMMSLDDNLGQQTLISFSNIKRNVAISPSQFSFVPPKGVDVIDQ